MVPLFNLPPAGRRNYIAALPIALLIAAAAAPSLDAAHPIISGVQMEFVKNPPGSVSLSFAAISDALPAQPDAALFHISNVSLGLPVSGERASSLAFDWRELQRWGIPASRIPPNALIEFRPPSLWDRYRSTAIPIAAAVILETVLIGFLLWERHGRLSSRKMLQERLRFETLLSDVSATFAVMPDRRIDEQVRACLARVAEFVNIEQTCFWRYDSEERALHAIYEWPILAPEDSYSVGNLEYCVGQLADGKAVRFSRPDQLPEPAQKDIEAFRAMGVRSFLAVPLYFGGDLVGALSFAMLSRETQWPELLDQRLRMLGEIFANAIVRQASEEAARQGEILNRAVLESLSGYVAIVDLTGRILRGNRAWNSLCDKIAARTPEANPVDRYYLDTWLAWTAPATEDNAALTDAVNSVLAQETELAAVEYRYRADGVERWIEIHIATLNRREGGAVITHLDVTARKKAEREAAKNLESIYHMDRVAAMGELATSLAHEINQPLAAISTNAESALTLLNRATPDIAEAKAALSDIIEDDHRAGEVIRKMRGLLKRGPIQVTKLDVNLVTAESVRLVASEALLRKLQLVTSLEPKLPLVTGDHVQLQQVILNLLSNAMQAMSQHPGSARSIFVRTRRVEGKGEIVVEVEDSAGGVPDWQKALIFEPFFSTKTDGLGMGLPISRSIIETNQGKLWVEDGTHGGSVFRFTLPIA